MYHRFEEAEGIAKMSHRKSPDERANRIKPTYPDLAITWDGRTRGEPLPAEYDWCEMTLKWWETIRNSAQAMSFHETDWQFLTDTARLHNRYWNPDPDRSIRNSEMASIMGELRRRTEQYGFTWADRRKYGISVATPDDVSQEAEQVTRQAAVDYRQKLTLEMENKE